MDYNAFNLHINLTDYTGFIGEICKSFINYPKSCLVQRIRFTFNNYFHILFDIFEFFLIFQCGT